MTDSSPLFTPFRLGTLELPNRFVMPGAHWDPDFVRKLESGDYKSIRTFAPADLASLEWDTSIVKQAHDVVV